MLFRFIDHCLSRMTTAKARLEGDSRSAFLDYLAICRRAIARRELREKMDTEILRLCEVLIGDVSEKGQSVSDKLR